MNNYFYKVVNGLIADDVIILDILFQQEATEKHKAIKNQTLLDLVNNEMSLAHYRNTIQRLQATCLISISSLIKDKFIYLTKYGITAIEQKMSKEESA